MCYCKLICLKNLDINNYRLRQSHYLSAQAISLDGMLNLTKVDPNLFHILKSTDFLKNLRQAAFLIFVIDIVKPIISICNLIN